MGWPTPPSRSYIADVIDSASFCIHGHAISPPSFSILLQYTSPLLYIPRERMSDWKHSIRKLSTAFKARRIELAAIADYSAEDPTLYEVAESRRVSKRRKLFGPFQSFPEDIGMEIFRRVVELEDEDASDDGRVSDALVRTTMTLYNVCKAWRLVLQSMSSLWSRIDLSRPSFALRCLQFCNTRSLHICGTLMDPDIFAARPSLSPNFREHRDSIATINVSAATPNAMTSFLDLLQRGPLFSLPSLVDLQLHVPPSLDSPDLVSHLEFPSLLSFKLDNVNIIFTAESVMALSSLQTCSFMWSRITPMAIISFLSCIGEAPSLQSLDLQCTPESKDFSVYTMLGLYGMTASRFFSLPHLTDIKMTNVRGDLAAALYNCIKAPALKHVSFCYADADALSEFLSEGADCRALLAMRECQCDLVLSQKADTLGRLALCLSPADPERTCACPSFQTDFTPPPTYLSLFVDFLNAFDPSWVPQRIKRVQLNVNELDFLSTDAQEQREDWETLLGQLPAVESFELSGVNDLSDYSSSVLTTLLSPPTLLPDLRHLRLSFAEDGVNLDGDVSGLLHACYLDWLDVVTRRRTIRRVDLDGIPEYARHNAEWVESRWAKRVLERSRWEWDSYIFWNSKTQSQCRSSRDLHHDDTRTAAAARREALAHFCAHECTVKGLYSSCTSSTSARISAGKTWETVLEADVVPLVSRPVVDSPMKMDVHFKPYLW
ncbi:hypothetical protein BXZ70DRAFT_1080668 [Cristinia sonorae]|uniref:F-box domain-containing protein n=1 Tax=Cristinia sonorae TaxID=1940300 RepID=A0A8K0UGS6_9AGAR|nr:hypothetical protein BXZ70DRAFT_1080668 [Cristinia sonorae]